MSLHTTGEFDAWLTKAQNLSFIEERDALEQKFKLFTKPGDVSEADYRSVTGARPGPAVFTPEGAKFYQDRYTQGSERVTTFKQYTIGVVTTWQTIKRLRENGRVKKNDFAFFQNMNKDFNKSMLDAKEIIAADFLVRADSTTATNSWPGAGRDSLALASSAHTLLNSGSIWSNAPTGSAMAPLTVKEAITMLRNQPDENGNPQGGVKRIGIMCGSYWEWRLPEIMQSTLEDGSDTNTINSLLPKYSGVEYEFIVNRWVGSSEKAWMVFDMDEHSMMHFEKDKPFFSKAIDPWTDNRINKAIMTFAIDFDSAKGVVYNSGP